MNTKLNSFTQKIASFAVKAAALAAITVSTTAAKGPISQPSEAMSPTRSKADNVLIVADLVALANNGYGDAALQEVAQIARELGLGNGAPRDTLAYDRFLTNARGSVLDPDEAEIMCRGNGLKADVYMQECIPAFYIKEAQIVFGPCLFLTCTGDNPEALRDADDVLATFIEETAHSWQEYLYETDGIGDGERLHITTLDEATYWAPGKEYQAKRYILSLDGILIDLSPEQRSMLMQQICTNNGYANPIGHAVPSYAAPADWPHPEFWTVTMPTADEFSAFCAGVSVSSSSNGQD